MNLLYIAAAMSLNLVLRTYALGSHLLLLVVQYQIFPHLLSWIDSFMLLLQIKVSSLFARLPEA